MNEYCSYCDTGYIKAYRKDKDGNPDVNPIGYIFSCVFCAAGKWNDKKGLPAWDAQKYGARYIPSYQVKSMPEPKPKPEIKEPEQFKKHDPEPLKVEVNEMESDWMEMLDE